MMRLRTALILGLGCATTLGCGSDLLDDILNGHGNPGGEPPGGGTGGSSGSVLHCGGNIANPPTCPAGLECVPDPASKLPFGDVGGICVKSAPKQFCGGFAGRPCPGGGKCVDDPSDSCDPANGGADCGGICQCVQNVACIKGAVFDSSPQVCACVPQAAPPPPVCGPVCLIFCEFGNVLDAKGCPTCSCNPPPPPPVCGPVCDIFCEFGNVLDAKGCPTCRCNPAPSPPVTCPPEKCTGPSPKSVNYVCPDGHTVAGPACVFGAQNGGCGWAVLSCPAVK